MQRALATAAKSQALSAPQGNTKSMRDVKFTQEKMPKNKAKEKGKKDRFLKWKPWVWCINLLEAALPDKPPLKKPVFTEV